jgi:hypothetical protein
MLTERETEKVQLFQETYNAMYLKEFSVQKLNFIKSRSNPVQNRLINNLSLIDFPSHPYNAEFIEGPIGIRKFKLNIKGKPEKTIHLFGEYHKKTTGQCKSNTYIEFDEYIYRLSRETPAFIDVYVEFPMVKSRIKNSIASRLIFMNIVGRMFTGHTFSDSYKYYQNAKKHDHTTYMFSRIHKKMKDCIQPETRMVPNCELIRLHNIDIRSTWDIDLDAKKIYTEDIALSLIRSIFQLGSQLFRTPDEILEVLRRVNFECPSILNSLKILIKDNDINLLDIFYKNKSLKKQLESSYKKTEIETWLKKASYDTISNDLYFRVKNPNVIFIDAIKKLISSIEKNTAFNEDDIKRFDFIFLKLNSLLVDVYFLARIFKCHNLKKHKSQGEFQPVESNNIIVYAGDAHTERMSNFFKSIGFKDEFKYYNPLRESCVQMSRVKTPVKQSQNLNILKLTELRMIAKNMNIKGYLKLNKKLLIELIIKTKKQSPTIKPSTVVQLKNVAREMGLKGYSKLKKEELIRLIKDSKK